MREWLEKHHEETEGEATVKLCLRALLELGGALVAKNIELCRVTKEGTATMSDEDVDALIKAVEEEKEAAEKEKKEKARRQAEEAPRRRGKTDEASACFSSHGRCKKCWHT